MKLKDEYKKYQSLIRDGYLFNPDECTFYSEKPKEFQRPKDFETWKVEKLEIASFLKERKRLISNKKEHLEIEVKDKQGSKTIQSILMSDTRGNIAIAQYSLDRVLYTYTEKGATSTSSTNREKYNEVVRLAPWNEIFYEGKYDHTHAKIVPCFPPAVVREYEAAEKSTRTIVITEGQLKSLTAAANGLHTIGLTSTSHFRHKPTGSLHPDVLRYVKDCAIERVVILWDGDCANISMKAFENREDISLRPYQFYKYAERIRTMLKEFPWAAKIDVFFATIRSKDLDDWESKGIDDLFNNPGHSQEAILQDFANIGTMPGNFIHWIDITTDKGLKKLLAFLNVDSVTHFYEAHRETIQRREFIYFGTTYELKEGAPRIKVSANLKQYFRVGTDYYRKANQPLKLPDGTRGYEEVILPWKRATIVDDHGQGVIDHLDRYIGFTIEPDHVDYQPVINGFYNLYQRLDHKPERGEWPHIEKLLRHIFQDQYTMALDYLTLLYRKPETKLPGICLVSKKQGTGKSTFANLLKLIFKQNAIGITGKELTGDFNAHWITKLLAISEETMIDKVEAYDKLKDLITRKMYTFHEKNRTGKEIPIHLHFVVISNYEDSFIRIDEEDRRLWIIKVEPFTEKIKGFYTRISDEIPYFVDELLRREIEYPDTGEDLYFAKEDFRTEAFRNVVRHSEPGVVKEIRHHLTEWFEMTEEQEIKMTATDIREDFGIKKDVHYINQVIKEYLKPRRPLDRENNTTSTTYTYKLPRRFVGDAPDPVLEKKKKGKFFIFDRMDYIKGEGKQTSLELEEDNK